jgi:uncharacterized repeat protein (TIGR02543 family)
MGSSAVTLTALWTQMPVVAGSANPADTVNFDSQGGSAVATITGVDGSSVALPIPTFAGHTFLGWFTSGSGGTLQASPLTLTAPSTTLYAQWSTNAVPASNSPKPAPSYRVIGVIRSFAVGSSALTPVLEVQVRRLATLIEARHFGDVILKGNATLPVSASNGALARARAIAVEKFLKQLGVHAKFAIEFTVSGATTFYLAVSVSAK